MEREVLVKRTISKINQLPTGRIQEVDDFIEFIIYKTENALITEGLQQLTSKSQTFDLSENEPELYVVNGLKEKKESAKTKLSEKYRGFLTSEEGRELNIHINQMRNEWNNI